VILYRWQGTASNFGDELNTILWPHLLPGFFDEIPQIRFLGIGSILDRRHPPDVIKIVAGSGYGGYEHKAAIDKRWIIHWVRGPRTAAALGLPQGLALGDPAVLIPRIIEVPTADARDIGFMPHFESAARGAWQQAADIAGMRLIDPRGPPGEILRAIGRCKLLLSEALHGAIVADALRVPWIALRPLVRVHRPKWHDWADTVALQLRFRDLRASTIAEWAAASRLSSFHATRVWLNQHTARLESMVLERLVTRAASALRLAANALPQLTTDAALDRCQSRMLEAVHAMRTKPLRDVSPAQATARPRSRLQPDDDSAYQLRPIG
jgi:succinoglycan biosynthesis protein ExoV